MESLRKIKLLSYDMKSALLRGNLLESGKAVGEEWFFKKRLDSKITNERIESVYKSALTNGAFGGKVLGAGDGGHVLF